MTRWLARLLERLAKSQARVLAGARKRIRRLAAPRNVRANSRQARRQIAQVVQAAKAAAGSQAAALAREVVDRYQLDPTDDDWLPPALEAATQAAIDVVIEKSLTLEELDATPDDELQALARAVESEVRTAVDRAVVETAERARRGKVVGARRIIHPDWSAGGACGLCVIAATRRYRTADLSRIHDGCKCTVLPILRAPSGEEIDPGRTINESDLGMPLKEVYRLAGSADPAKLKRLRFERDPKGELYIRDDSKPKNPTERIRGRSDAEQVTKTKAKRSKARPLAPLADTPKGHKRSAAEEKSELLKRGPYIPEGLNVLDHEASTARKLHAAGHTVEFLPLARGEGVKSPDALLDGEVTEFKAPRGSSERNTISDQFKRGRKQARRLVIDLQRCGLPDELALDQCARRFHGPNSHLDLLIVIDKAEALHIFRR